MAANAADFYFSANAKEVVQAINGIQTRLRKLEQSGAPAADVGKQMGGGFNFAAGAAGALKTALGAVGIASFAAGAMKAVGAIKDFGTASISAASEMETYQTRFSTLLGDADKAKEHLQSLTDYAAKTPFDMAGISKASSALLAFGIDAKESHNVLRMLGDVAAASGADLNELAQIYGKVNTAGKMDTQDINQLANRALNLRALFAERDNISVAEVNKRISGGKYGLEDLRWAIAKETGEGGKFFQGAEKLSGTLAGKWSTLQDNVKQVQAEVGDLFLPTMKALLETGIELVNKWGNPFKRLVQDTGRGIKALWRGAQDVSQALESWLPGVMATKAMAEGLLAPFAEMVRLRNEEYAAEQELARLSGETLNKTVFELEAERRLAEETRQRALQEQIAADNAERAAKAAEKEAETRKRMRADLAADRAKREADAARDLFASQNSAGMKAELAYRFRQATGKEWQGVAGIDEAALRAAEDKAARKADAGAMAELAALREYAGLYAETLQKEIEVQNQRTAALDAARAAEVQAAELADARERGDLAAVQDLEAAAAAERKYAELRGLGMEHAEAANWAAGAAGREHGRSGMASAPGEWMRDDLAAVGGGGAAIRIPNAQLAVQRQQLSAAQLTNKLLEKLLQKPATVTGLPVVP
jgi:hypothetical protein